MQIRVFILVGNCKANLKASASYKRHLETRLESKRVLEGVGEEGAGWDKALKNCGIFILHIDITGTLQKKLSQTTGQFNACFASVQEQS